MIKTQRYACLITVRVNCYSLSKLAVQQKKRKKREGKHKARLLLLNVLRSNRLSSGAI